MNRAPQQNAIEAFQQGQRDGAERRAQQAQAQAQQQAANLASNQQSIQRRVGELAMSGDCRNAEGMAMGNGMIELANQVTTYCASHFPNSAR